MSRNPAAIGHLLEINRVVWPDCKSGSVAQLDKPHARIWEGIGFPLEQAWLSILFTADRRWS